MTPQLFKKLEAIANGKPFLVRKLLIDFLAENPPEKTEKPYTDSQRNAAWLYITLKVKQLNESGLEMRKVLKPDYSIPWTKESFHDHIWIPIQKAMYGTKSMKQLTKAQIDPIHEVIERELSEKHELEYIPFPSDEEKDNQRLKALEMAKKFSYPDPGEDFKEPTI